MQSYISKTPEDTFEFAKDFAARLKPGDAIAFRGGLGAGKTLFVRGLAEGLGLNPDDVASPTFALLNIYKSDRIALYHFDMYRVTSFDSLESTGFFDFLDSDGILAIEWSENIASELPENVIIIAITPLPGDERRIEVMAED